MRAIRIKAWQTMASYRMPTSFIIKESYPLPPYSTVIGMIHVACGFKEYVPMDVSIQGNGYSSISDLYTKYDFNPGIKYEKGRHQLEIPCEDHSRGVTRAAGQIELIVDVELLLHIKPHDESKLDQIAEGLRYPIHYPSLGRWEDLLRIDSVQIVEVQETVLDELFELPYNAYVPSKAESLYGCEADWYGTIYSLNKDYVIDAKTNFRKWSTPVRARYASKNSCIMEDMSLLLDADSYPVFFA